MRKTLILILTLFAVFTTVDARSKKDQDRALIDKVAMSADRSSDESKAS